MIEIRTLKSQSEIEMAYILCNHIFFKCESFFERRYPHVFHEVNINNLFGAFNGKQLVSFVATYPTKIEFTDTFLNVSVLGAVCTQELFQGQGISTSILNYVENRLRGEIDLLVISGEGRNYIKFGAMPVGKIYEVHVPKEKLNISQNPYLTVNSIMDLDVERYYEIYQQKSFPKFKRTLNELELMIKGHLEPLNNEHNYVLHDFEKESYSCVRIGFEGNTKIAFIIESVGKLDKITEMIEDFAYKNNCDKLFYRTTEIVKKHEEYMLSIPITGTMKVINPDLKISALDLFGDLKRRGHYPSIRVDGLNFL